MRVSVNLKTSFSVLIPEETFQPVIKQAEILDMSERGALISVELDDRTYSQLLHTTRYCKLSVKGEPRLPEKIVGKAVWIQREGTHASNCCKVGLYFEDLNDAVAVKIRSYINDVIRNGEAQLD